MNPEINPDVHSDMYSVFLRVGDKSPRVAEVRGTLARLGLLESFSGDASDSNNQQWTEQEEYFDEELSVALRGFQQGRGIIADGVISATTLRALREASYTLGNRVLSLQTNEYVGDDVAQLLSLIHI